MLPHSTISVVVTTNKAIKVSSFQNNENIQKKAEGQECTSSVTLNGLAKKAFCIFEFQECSQSKDLYKSKCGPNCKNLFQIHESKHIICLASQYVSADLKGPDDNYKLHYGRCTGLF